MNTLDIQRHVFGQNELNRITKEELKHLLPQLQQYVGKKIYTQLGTSKAFLIDFKKAMAITDYGMNYPRTSCYLKSNNKEIDLIVDLDYSIKHPNRDYSSPKGFKCWLTVGKLSHGGYVLDSVLEYDEIVNSRTDLQDLDIAHELDAVRKYLEVKEKLLEASSQIKVPKELYDSYSRIV